MHTHPLTSYATVWSNFEIGDLDFWRESPYVKLFDHLDTKGGFYYEVRTATSYNSHPHKSYRCHHTDTGISRSRHISDGVMHPYTASVLRCSRERSRFTSSTTSVSVSLLFLFLLRSRVPS